MESEEQDRIANAWRESAPYWEKHRERLRTMFEPLTVGLVEATSLAAGHHVLDVAGGPGEPAFSIAERLGPGGRIVTTDLAEGMVAATHREAERVGSGNVLCAVCSAMALPFRDASFDHAVCRLGAMFFPDTEAGVREMSRVTRPGGRVAFVVWGGLDRNPFFRVPSEVLARFVPAEPEPPDAPNAWRFGEPGVLEAHLRAAGLADVSETLLSFDIALPIDFDEFWRMRVELSDSLREKLSRLDDTVRASLGESVRQATASFFPAGTMCFPSEVLVVAGTAASH